MANTIRVKVIRSLYSDNLFIVMPGDNKDAVIAPMSWTAKDVSDVVRLWLKAMKAGDKFTMFGHVNLADNYFKRLLKHQRNQKFFVDVKINTH